MSEAETLFAVLRQSADAEATAAIEHLVRDGADRDLCRLNVLDFATRYKVDTERAIAAFLHAARLGLFDLSWNVLCPGCGGVLDAGATLKTLDKTEYHCSLCAAGYEATVDEMVEVTFTVRPRVRRIAAHDPSQLSMAEYARQLFWSSGVDIPDNYEQLIQEITLDFVELPPGEKAILSLQLPAKFLIMFDPVTHSTHFIDVKGEPSRERQSLSIVFNELHAHNETIELRPGPLRLALENSTARRGLPGVWISRDALHGGPCLAVTLNDRQDYFGQTVNIASRVQGLAMSRAIFATDAVVNDRETARLLKSAGLSPLPQRRALRGIADEVMLYEIP